MTTKTILEAEQKPAARGKLRLASGLRSRGWDTGLSNAQLEPLLMVENKQALSADNDLQFGEFAGASGAAAGSTVWVRAAAVFLDVWNRR